MIELPPLEAVANNPHATTSELYVAAGSAIWQTIIAAEGPEQLPLAGQALARITDAAQTRTKAPDDYYDARTLQAYAPLHEQWAADEATTPGALQQTYAGLSSLLGELILNTPVPHELIEHVAQSVYRLLLIRKPGDYIAVQAPPLTQRGTSWGIDANGQGYPPCDSAIFGPDIVLPCKIRVNLRQPSWNMHPALHHVSMGFALERLPSVPEAVRERLAAFSKIEKRRRMVTLTAGYLVREAAEPDSLTPDRRAFLDAAGEVIVASIGLTERKILERHRFIPEEELTGGAED